MKEEQHKKSRDPFGSLESLDLEGQRRVIQVCAEQPQRFGTKFFIEAYQRLSDPICAWYALRALGDLGERAALEILLAALEKPDVEIGNSSLHRIAARSIGKLGASIAPTITESLHRASGQSLIALIDALGELRSADSIPELTSLLRSFDREVSVTAALALAKIGTPAIDQLESTLAISDGILTFVVLDALAIIDHPDIVPALALAARRNTDAIQRYLIMGNLGRIERLRTLIREVAQSDSRHAATAQSLMTIFSREELHA